jgi:nitronate monooxygenase
MAQDGPVTVIDSLELPIVQAPMAGGGSTPELAAAVSGAGGLGFLAGGYLTVEALGDQIRALRERTGRPFGVNLLVPGNPAADAAALAGYRDRLAVEATRYGVALGTPAADDDGWAGKLALMRQAAVAVVSFTFGCPHRDVIAQLKRHGIDVVVTVTSAEEAAHAVACGADVICVQGPEAGGHRATFDNADRPGDVGLLPLLRQIAAVVDVPMVAAGGLAHGRDVAGVLAAGATAAQLGTVFLACPESGADPLHKAALADPSYSGTAVTRAFSGRPARGLANRFLVDHSGAAPAAYPHVHHMTRPLRAAAAQAGDPAAMSLWAGQGHRLATAIPAADLARSLAAQAASALADAARRWSAL